MNSIKHAFYNSNPFFSAKRKAPKKLNLWCFFVEMTGKL
nr:MAG TPA: hypothetical protein [Caudoviricetes sp.]